RVIAISQMETTGARHTFPCFDEPAFKATFDFTLYHRSDQGFYAVANMPPIMFQTEMIDTVLWNSTTFDTTYVMSTYLLAVTVSDFLYEPATSTAGSPTTIFLIPKSGELSFFENICKTADNCHVIAITFFQLYQMAVADFGAGAMENWGLVLYRETLLLFDENISSVHDKYSITQVIGHELGHQWFGNLVTCAWWNEIWLNEGFASYVQYIAVDGVKPEYKPWEIFIIDDLQIALSADAYSNSHPLVHPEGRFSSITYSKKYILDLVVPSIYADLGWDDSNTSDSALITRYSIDAACTYGNQDCIDNAVMLFDQWRNDTTTIISSTYRTDVFCTAIREGGLAEWDFAWEQYLLSQNAQFQSSLRYGLSCSKDAWVLNRYLEYAMDPTKVRKQDIQNTFSYIARQEYGKYTAWAFAMNNWDRVINQYVVS
uniref:Aminopeptidase n=1 Tax=Ciona savignyi TaxID=51511 RepID=H2YKR6_CIOSA